MKLKKKNGLIFLLVLTLLVIPFIQAVRLDTGTVLNATGSNSTMTFSIPIDVDSVTVESTQITLTNIICSNGAVSTDTNLIWDTENANRDSEFYCALGCSNSTRTGYRLIMILASVGLISAVALFVYKKYENDELTVGNIIILFISIIVGIALWLASGQSLGASCGPVG